VPDGPDAAAQGRAQRAEVALAAVYAANDLATVDFNAAIDAAVLGDGAFKVTWDAIEGRPIVTPVDVQCLSVWWDQDDPRRVVRVVQRSMRGAVDGGPWTAGGGQLPSPGPLSSVGGPPSTVVEDWRLDRFTLTVGGKVVRDEANPFGWLPYVIFANAPRPQEFWGESDLTDLLDVGRELNRRLSVVSRILELSGNPIAVLENVESAEGIQVGPGALWELPEGAKAYLLDLLGGGGVGLHLQYIDLLYRVIHDLAETPRTARSRDPTARAKGQAQAARLGLGLRAAQCARPRSAGALRRPGHRRRAAHHHSLVADPAERPRHPHPQRSPTGRARPPLPSHRPRPPRHGRSRAGIGVGECRIENVE
jgi:hypothetical protein